MAFNQDYSELEFEDYDLETLLSEFYTTENLVSKRYKLHEANQGQDKNYPFYDRPDEAPGTGSYWYVSKVVVCRGKDNIGVVQLQTEITNSKTGQVYLFKKHGLLATYDILFMVLAGQGKCQTINFSQDDCVNWAQVGYKSGRRDKDFRGFKLRTRSGKTYEFATGDKKTTFYEPISFGTECLSGFHGTFKDRTERSKGFQDARGSLQTIGFYSNALYQKEDVNSISKITGTWVRVGSGSNASQSMEEEVVQTDGKEVTQQQQSSLTVGNTVDVGFSYSSFGYSASVNYSHSRSKEESQSVATAVKTQLSHGIKRTCSSTCGPSNGKRTNVFQWVWDLQSSGPLGEMQAKTCDYVCNTNMRKPPRCNGSIDCIDEQCTECFSDDE